MAYGKFRFTVPEGATEFVLSEQDVAAKKGSPTVQFVHGVLESEMPPSEIMHTWSYSDVQVAELVRHEDRAGVAAELLRILSDPTTPYEWTHVTLQALEQMTETEGVVEGLLALLKNPPARLDRGKFSSALREPKRKVSEVIDAILPLVEESKARQRWGAYYALGQIAGKQPEFRQRIAPILIGGLADPFYMIREHAAGALGWAEVAEAKEPLAALLNDPDTRVRLAAGRALWKIDGDRQPLVQLATGLLAHESMETRQHAANAVSELEKLPPATLDALRANLLEESGPPFRSREDSARTWLSRAARSILEKHGAIEKQPPRRGR
jgi:hypothetical protein